MLYSNELARLKALGTKCKYTTILVRYLNGSANEHTYKAPKSAKLKSGDYVCVPVGTGFAIAHIVHVHKKATFPNIPHSFSWIVAKVSFTAYKKLQEEDTQYEMNRAKPAKPTESASDIASELSKRYNLHPKWC